MPALVGKVDNAVLRAVVDYLDWYEMATRSTEHTYASLEAMEQQGVR